MKISRRNFMRLAGAMGAAVAATSAVPAITGRMQDSIDYETLGAADDYTDTFTRRSVCLQCHSACGVQATLKNVAGSDQPILIKLDGNPYHPNCLEEHLPYDTVPAIGEQTRGAICAKSHAGIQTLYDPMRIKQPLKRAGPRGSGQWEVISWDQALEEIVEGGTVAGHTFDGLRTIRDTHTNVDSSAPELGPKANQLVFMCGRNEHGQKEFTDRFFQYSYGTINKRNDHTSICETSHHVGYRYMCSGKNHMKPDIPNADLIIWFGTSPLEAGFPMEALARKLMLNKYDYDGSSKLQMIVVDPRFSATANKADVWVPIKPGTDAALALAMGRYLIENDLINTSFLSKTTIGAAEASAYTNSTYLVKTTGAFYTYYTASDAGIGGVDDADKQVVSTADGLKVFDAVDDGVLDPTGLPHGVKTVFQLYKDRVMERTLAEYSAICDVSVDVIEDISARFGRAGRRACADHYRGTVQHTNGTYSAMSIIALNFLVGNVNVKGGMTTGGSHWHEFGGKAGNPYAQNSAQLPDKQSTSGVQVNRASDASGALTDYTASAEYAANGFPAQRPWFPLAKYGNWQDIYPSIGESYPYPVKAVINYYGSSAYSTPGAKDVENAVYTDESKLPLFVSIDAVMGETTAYADYILPDSTWPERWSTPHVSPAIPTTTSGVRQPLLAPDGFNPEDYLDDSATLRSVGMLHPNTRRMEDVLIDIAKRLGLPNFGSGGLGDAGDLEASWHWHRLGVLNIAYGDKEDDSVPGATDAERVEYVLDRGGRFEGYDKAYSGDFVAHKFKNLLKLWVDDFAKTRDSITGDYYDGLPRYDPIMFADGSEVNDSAYPYWLNTYKPAWHTQSRTVQNQWLMEIWEENYIEISKEIAIAKGLSTGDKARLSSPTGSVTGKVRVRPSNRPDLIVVCHSFGHWQAGATGWSEDGTEVEGLEYRTKGVESNSIMRLDDTIGKVALTDPLGASSSFYDTRVDIEKI